MKYYYSLILLLLCSVVMAQTVAIPDTNFKNALLSYSSTIDTNGDGEIQITEAQAVTQLDLREKSIQSLTGIASFTNLTLLNCSKNQLTSLDVSQNTVLSYLSCSENQIAGSLDLSNNPGLTSIYCSKNQLTSIDVTNCTVLDRLDCDQNQLSSLDLSQNVALAGIHCQNNQLTSLDVSQNINMTYLYCSTNPLGALDLSNNTLLQQLYCWSNQLGELDLSQNPAIFQVDCSFNQLKQLYIKNGTILTTNDYFHFNDNPGIEFICIDEAELPLITARLNEYGYTNSCAVNSYCTFVPGGALYQITGTAILDSNSDGCDVSDNRAGLLNFHATNGTVSGHFYSDVNGVINSAVSAGSHTITPVFEHPSYYTVSPTSYTVSFPNASTPYQQDFCITSNGVFNDLEVAILPLVPARPGFEATYKLIYRNKGTAALTGSVDFNYDNDHVTYGSASVAPNAQGIGALQWSFNDLQPFEIRSVLCTFMINAPTHATFPVNADDILPFTATVNPLTGDETPNDNVFSLKQVVVNAHDPNDKTCLQGNTIEESQVGDYLHYLIRFENTGSASAVNIVVKDVIDTTKYEISSLQPLDASHGYTTRIKNNVVEFIFENINLPIDDANNDGYVAFKIKSKDNLVVGDKIENKAEIYFDYNFPIITEKESTEVVNLLSVSDYELDNSIGMFPNPVKAVLNISASSVVKQVSVFDVQGRQLQQISYTNQQKIRVFNFTDFAKGVYFVKVTSAKGVMVAKINK